jgi:hypothetical protein
MVETLHELFSVNEPLGPSFIDPEIDDHVLQQIYEGKVRPYDNLSPEDSSYIVGRRGSGKTTLLLASTGFGSQPNLRLHESAILSGLKDLIQSVERDYRSLSLEDSVDIWQLVFTVCGATYLSAESRDSPERIQMHEAIGALEIACGYHLSGPTEVVNATLDLVLSKARSEGVQGSFKGWLDRIALADVTMRRLRELVDEDLKRVAWRLTVLIDSLDEMNRRPTYYALALSPLLCILGRQARLRPPLHGIYIRCCFPSEMMPVLDDISDNPNKDFNGICYIQWHTSELLQVVDSRLDILATVLADDGDDALRRRLQTLTSLTPRDRVCGLLPETVHNLAGSEEETLPYLYRHTQLLPRQLLKLLSSLFRGRDRIERLSRTGRALESDILGAVLRTEAELVTEVLTAHKATFQSGRQILDDLVPNLPSTFAVAELQGLYESLGLRRYATSFEEFRHILIGMGVVGRVERETERYIRGEFAYTFPSGFNPAEDDQLCLHPMFSRHQGRRPSARKPIYPAAPVIDDEPIQW